MHDPQISVLMCVYNGEQWINESIESVLCQQGVNFEFIVVNDGSTDNTKKILQSYKDKRLTVYNRENYGLTKSLNYGLKKCHGKYIARIDADDICMPNRLKEQLKFLLDNPDIKLVGSNAKLIDLQSIYNGYANYPSEHKKLVDRLLNFESIFPHSSIFFEREIIIKLGGYDENYFRSQDYDLYLRLSKVYRISTIEKPLISLRLNVFGPTLNDKDQLIYGLAGLINYYRREKNLFDYSKAEKNLWKDFILNIKNWVDSNEISKIYIYKRDFRLFRIYIKQKNYIKAFKIFFNKLIKNPTYLKKKILNNVPYSIRNFLA